MNIGEAAARSGLSVRTIRYYEGEGLVTAKRRPGGGYRDFDADDVHRLTFLARARALGFSLEDCRRLLALYDDRDRASADVKRLALARIAEIDAKIQDLRAMRATLSTLAAACAGDDRPRCPILDGLAPGEGFEEEMDP